MTSVLTADCVGKSFDGRRVLTSASLRAVAGELRVMLGRNGVGKSTLIKIAAGRIAPDSGVVHCDGRVHPRASLRRLALRWLAQSTLRPDEIRFDVVSVLRPRKGPALVEHVRAAF